ncbi:MAG TPA: DUF6094 domain-containing protein [Candidatus Angelobacter sp.]|nr:DUF6094 domain-containing protein [Candidatus Angelobacter sp.]
MRNYGRLKLGFFPLPHREAERLRKHLAFPDQSFPALDPCVGDGAAFHIILDSTPALRYGVELDAYRVEQARKLGIEVVHGNTLDTECKVDTLSFLYLNPPYDFEAGQTGNQRMESIFLRHTGRWLMPGGVLFLIIPQQQISACSRTLAEHFEMIRVYRLTAPESVKYNQVAVLAIRRGRNRRLRDDALALQMEQIERLSRRADLDLLPDVAEARYCPPPSGPITLVHNGLPLDEIEDKLKDSAAYRQVRRVLLRETETVRARPLTPLHGGHVGLLCTAGLLNGVFGEGDLRHVANWQSRKFTKTWSEIEDGNIVNHTREHFTHECTLLWADGHTQILTHEPQQEDILVDESASPQTGVPEPSCSSSKVIVMPGRIN